MGASTTAQLIARGKAENGYNNSGISSDGTWTDFFNDALRDLVEDLNIVDVLPPLSYVAGTREVDLPANFYGIAELYDGNKVQVHSRDTYMQQYPAGYYVMFRGSKYVLDLYNYSSSQTFTGLYQRHAKLLTNAANEIPEIPTVGEKALPYFAIWKALLNGFQTDDAREYERKYNEERKKLRTATARARGY